MAGISVGISVAWGGVPIDSTPGGATDVWLWESGIGVLWESGYFMKTE